MKYYGKMHSVEEIKAKLMKLGFRISDERSGEGYIVFAYGLVDLEYIDALYVNHSRERFIVFGTYGKIIATDASDNLMGQPWYDSLLECFYEIKESFEHAEYPETDEEEEELQGYREFLKSKNVKDLEGSSNLFITMRISQKQKAGRK